MYAENEHVNSSEEKGEPMNKTGIHQKSSILEKNHLNVMNVKIFKNILCF